MEVLRNDKFIRAIAGYIIIIAAFGMSWAFIFMYSGDPPNSDWFYGTVTFILGLFVKAPNLRKRRSADIEEGVPVQ